MDKIILKILLGFIKLFASKDIDMQKLTIIAETKVMMDRRRSPASWRQKQQKEMKNPLLFTLLMYFFLSIFMSIVIFNFQSIVISMVFLHAYLLFMMAMTLVTDFSSVLLDTTDNQIILSKPVNSRTLFLARTVHILVYLLQFTLAIAILPIVATFIKFGLLVGIAVLLTVLLTVAFAVFLTYLLYATILRFANEQKVKDIISYFQIAMTIFFAVGYQILPRLINFNNINFTFQLHWYSYFLPPVWMALTLDAIHQFTFDAVHVSMIFCAVMVPIFTVWLMIKFLAPSFSRKLGALNNNSEVVKKTGINKKANKDFAEKLSPVMCNSPTEGAGFENVWKITGRDKSFKMQFYPSLAYLLIFAFIFVFKSGKDLYTVWQDLPNTKSFLWFIYLPIFTISTSLSLVAFNENFAASWVYQSVPLANPGQLISGTIKALLAKFFVPIYLILFAFAFYIWGPAIVDDFVLGFFSNLLIFLIVANLSEHYLPFSQQQNIKQQTGKFIKIISQMIIVGALVGLHYLALKIYWLPLALIPFSAIGYYFLLKRVQRLPWAKISI